MDVPHSSAFLTVKNAMTSVVYRLGLGHLPRLPEHDSPKDLALRASSPAPAAVIGSVAWADALPKDQEPLDAALPWKPLSSCDQFLVVRLDSIAGLVETAKGVRQELDRGKHTPPIYLDSLMMGADRPTISIFLNGDGTVAFREDKRAFEHIRDALPREGQDPVPDPATP